MQARVVLFLLLANWVFPVGRAGAQVVIGEPAPEVELRRIGTHDNTEEKIKLVGKRGIMVVLYFWRPSDATSVEYLDTLAKVEKLPGVDVLLISMEKEEETNRALSDKDFGFVWIAYEAQGGARLYDVSHFPRCYIVDPNGILVWRGHPGEVEQKLKEQIRITPPAGADAAALRSKLARSREALSRKHYGRAFTLARQVVDLTAESDENHGPAVQLRDEIEGKAREWLDEARKLADDKKYEEACRIVAEMKVRMEGREIVKDVETEITRLRGARESKKMLDDTLRDLRATLQMEQAQELVELKRYVDADRAYRSIIESFEESPVAKQADEALTKLRQDPKTLELIKAHYTQVQAERWMDLGDRFAKLNFPVQAREYYERIIKEHGGTDTAKRAEKKLKELNDKPAPKENKQG